MVGGTKYHGQRCQDRRMHTYHSSWDCWTEQTPFGPRDEGLAHHISYTIGLTKVLVAPIVDLAFVNRTLRSGDSDAGDHP